MPLSAIWRPRAQSPYALFVVFFALVSDEISQVIDAYATHEEAEAEVRDALADEPELRVAERGSRLSLRRVQTRSAAGRFRPTRVA